MTPATSGATCAPSARAARRFRRRGAAAAGLLLAAPLAYAIAALALGLLARNAEFQAAADGTPVYVIANLAHADLVVPAHALSLVRAGGLRPADLGMTERADPYLALGWGDREFYLTTPTWADLRAGTAWRALTGADSTLMHVEAIDDARVLAGARELRLAPAQLARLVQFIEASFAVDAQGQVQRVSGARYGTHDAFYVARGRYSALYTCNEWARAALATAGVRTPWWSPFPQAIDYQLGRSAARR